MRVFVTGATGAVGRHLVPALVARGHSVTATTRAEAKASGLRAAGADPVVLDGLDRDAVIAAVREARPDVVVHEMTALSAMGTLRHIDEEFAATNALRTRGTDNLLEAAAAAGVRRVVAQSNTFLYAREGGPVKSEDDPVDTHPVASAAQTVAAMRYVDETVPLKAEEGIVLRYGSFYGPGASLSLLDAIRRRQMPVIGGGTGVWSFIETSDAAAATIAAIERGEPGAYNVVDDDPAPVADWLPYLAHVLGAKPPRSVPTWLARPLAGEFVLAQMTQGRGASNRKAREELGWEPRYASWRDGFPRWVAA